MTNSLLLSVLTTDELEVFCKTLSVYGTAKILGGMQNYKGGDYLIDWEFEFKHNTVDTKDYNSTNQLDTSVAVIKKGNNLWGLKHPSNWSLSKQAADYYMLQLATIVDEETYKPYLDKKTEVLVDQFSRYTDMAVGGELRHSKQTSHMPKRLREAFRNGVLKKNGKSQGRASAWEGWYWLRQNYGTVALLWAVRAFNHTQAWSSGYGGTKWANIANTLYMYEKGEITEHAFIDTCWGLQHNGGIYFNKWWQTGGTKHILDINLRGEYCQLWHMAGHAIQSLIPTELAKEHCSCSQCLTNS